MNYIIAFLVIFAGTILALISGDKDTYWLFVSDGNVAIALIIAWYLGRLEPPKKITVNLYAADNQPVESDREKRWPCCGGSVEDADGNKYCMGCGTPEPGSSL